MMWFEVVFYLSFLSPVILLSIVWVSLLLRQKSKFAVAIAALASSSYGYLMAALVFRSILLGEDYSQRLFITIYTNAGVAFCLFVLAVWFGEARFAPNSGLVRSRSA